MSNKASDNLHKLIKSMTKPEKRYFKVFSSRHVIGDQNNYQILFDAIDRQEDYDEEKLLKKFRNEAFINRFSIAKSRLYQSILRSLDAFHANSSVEAQLKRQLHCAEILYNKSLYDQSFKLLRSARKVAQKHDKTTTLLEIGKWEKRLLEKDGYDNVDDKKLAKILKQDHELLATLNGYSELWNLKSKVFKALYLRGKVRSEAEMAQYSEMLKGHEAFAKGDAKHPENQYLYNHLSSAYYFGLGDYEKSYPYITDNIDVIERNKHIFEEEPNVYLSVLTNAIHVATRLGKAEEAFQWIDKMDRAGSGLSEMSNEDREMRLFAISKSAELNLLLQRGEFEKGIEMVPEIEEGLLKYEEKLSSVRKAALYFNIAVAFFGHGDFNEALKWTNQLLNNINIDKTQDIHCMGQILNLIIHIELGNKSLLPYTLRSTQRYLETRNRVYKFESVFLSFINELLKKRPTKSLGKLYIQLSNDLEALKGDHFERHAFEYFDFLGWAQKKSTSQFSEDQEA